MATDTSTTVVALHPKRALTGAERAAAYRARKKAQNAQKCVSHMRPVVPVPVTKPATPRVTPASPAPSRVTPQTVTQWLLVGTSIGLAGLGMAINGSFARSLGSSESAGWLFLGLGIAADAIALTMPSAAASAWQARQRVSAGAGWLIWSIAFTFVLVAGIGFASQNVTDVTLSRAGRVTPQVETAQAALRDAQATRDRECAGGVGKNCRVREEAVAEQRRLLQAAMATVAQAADPQTESAARIVSWLTGGVIAPKGDDFAMLRLILVALLPQLGGLLLMVGQKR